MSDGTTLRCFVVMWEPRSRERKKIEGRYSVDKDGVVWSGDMPLKPVDGKWVAIHGQRRFVSYVVARAWVPNPEGREFVRHKNGDLRDNRAVNLEWSDVKEAGARRGRKPVQRRIGQFSADGEMVGQFWTVADAAESAGVRKEALRAALRRRGGCGGWIWMWL